MTLYPGGMCYITNIKTWEYWCPRLKKGIKSSTDVWFAATLQFERHGGDGKNGRQIGRGRETDIVKMDVYQDVTIMSMQVLCVVHWSVSTSYKLLVWVWKNRVKRDMRNLTREITVPQIQELSNKIQVRILNIITKFWYRDHQGILGHWRDGRRDGWRDGLLWKQVIGYHSRPSGEIIRSVILYPYPHLEPWHSSDCISCQRNYLRSDYGVSKLISSITDPRHSFPSSGWSFMISCIKQEPLHTSKLLLRSQLQYVRRSSIICDYIWYRLPFSYILLCK